MPNESNRNISYLIVEDREEDRRQLNDLLADVGFDPGLRHEATTKEEAIDQLNILAGNLDVVFLDLNIPLNSSDTRPERDNGRSILQFIHKDLNNRPQVDVRVIIVSGEDIHDGFTKANMADAYGRTLIGTCPKTDLAPVLKASLRRLRRDPIRSDLRKAAPDLEDAYIDVVDGNGSIRDRLEAAKDIARWLLACDLEYMEKSIGAAQRYGDNIGRLVEAVIETRFRSDDGYAPKPTLGMLKPGMQWKDNPWRGTMIQHIRNINSYRNGYTHISEQPYDNLDGHAWTPDPSHLIECQDGKAVASILALIVTDLLRWLLPWHQAVYVPWRDGGRR